VTPSAVARCWGLHVLGCPWLGVRDGLVASAAVHWPHRDPGSHHDRARQDGGQPCIRGHRFTVEHLLNLVGAGWSLEQIQADFPFIEAQDIQQAIAYAAFSVREYHLPITRPA
jgi:uncharacterized protein (DUF433 family)